MKTILSLLLLIIASSTLAGDLTTGYTFSQGEANITHLKLNQAVNDAVVVSASASLAGKVELATDAETITGTDALRAVTPAGLAALLAADITFADDVTIGGGAGGGDLLLTSGAPTITMLESDQAADEKRWRIVPTGKQLLFQTRTDADGAGITWMTVQRGTGTAVSSINMSGPLTSTTAGASTSAAGTVELATSAETLARTDTARAVTPAGVAVVSNYSVGSQLTTVGNVGAGEDTLWTQSVAANTLSTDGNAIRVTLTGTIGAGDNPRIKVKWGATNIFNDTLSTSFGAQWRIEAWIVRTGAATQRCLVTAHSDVLFGSSVSFPQIYTATTETLSGAVTLAVTAEESSDNAATLQIAKANFVP